MAPYMHINLLGVENDHGADGPDIGLPPDLDQRSQPLTRCSPARERDEKDFDSADVVYKVLKSRKGGKTRNLTQKPCRGRHGLSGLESGH